MTTPQYPVPWVVQLLAKGSEYCVFRVQHAFEDGVTRVMKVPGTLTWHIFHHFSSDTVKQDLCALDDVGVPYLQTELHGQPIVYTADGLHHEADFALFQPEVELHEVTEAQLAASPQLRKQLAICLQQSLMMVRSHGRGIDFTGMQLVGEWIKHQVAKLVYLFTSIGFFLIGRGTSGYSRSYPEMDPTLYNWHLQEDGTMILMDVGLLPVGERNVVGLVNQVLMVFQTALVQLSLEHLCEPEETDRPGN